MVHNGNISRGVSTGISERKILFLNITNQFGDVGSETTFHGIP